MQIDDTTSGPDRQSPHHRYASLHRAIERGMASTEIWRDLALVCLELGQEEEAARICRQMSEGQTKWSLQAMLSRLGKRVPSRPRPEAVAVGPSQRNPGEPPRLVSHAIDAFEYLLHSHMPLVTLVAILAFPVVVGVGGFLTAGGSALLLPAIALLPGLCVMGLVGGMARTILLASAGGEELPPAVPELRKLGADCLKFGLDALLLPLLLIGPAVLMFWLKLPFFSTLPVLAAGALLLPMALSLRQLRGDWRALAPAVLMPAMFRCGGRYLGLAGIFWLLFVPAVVALVCAAGAPLYLQISLAGPLTVAPLFANARLLGTFLDAHAGDLGDLLQAEGNQSVREMLAKNTAPTHRMPARTAPKKTAPTPAKTAAKVARKPLAPAVSASELAQAREAAAEARPSSVARKPAAPPRAGQRPAPAPAPAPKTAPKPAAKPAPRPAPTGAPARPPAAPAPTPAKSQPVVGQTAAKRAAPAARPTAPANQRPVTEPNPRPAMSARAAAPASARPAAPASARPAASANARPAPAAQPARQPAAPASPAPAEEPAGETPPPELSMFPGASIVQGDDRHRFGASSRSR